MQGPYARSNSAPDGLKTKVKAVLVNAFRKGLSQEYWQNFDDSVQDFYPEDQVLEEFPVKSTKFPFVRISISFGKTTWMNLNRYWFQEHAQMTQNAELDIQCNVDIFALSSKQRDRIEDAYLFMLLFGYNVPKQAAFYKEMNHYDDVSIKPILNSIDIERDSITKDIPWCKDTPVYQGALSFKCKVTYAFNRGDFIARLRMIGIKAEDVNEIEREAILAGA